MTTERYSEPQKEDSRTALDAALEGLKVEECFWTEEYRKSISVFLRQMMEEDSSFSGAKEWLKSSISSETSEYDREELKWIRYRQARSKTVDDIVKKKDELARSIKEGKVDLDRVISSAADGDVGSLILLDPHFRFWFQSFQPSWLERIMIWISRTKIDDAL